MAALSACSPNPNGQGVTDVGFVKGTVVDAAHPSQPIPTAVVQIGVGTTRISPVDKGYFRLAVPTGTQSIVISSPGFAGYSAQVVVRKDQESDLGFIGLASTAP
ncbi:MAG: hypothetical protein NVS3B7_10010 [Candidatus Elarobacter sp.]